MLPFQLATRILVALAPLQLLLFQLGVTFTLSELPLRVSVQYSQSLKLDRVVSVGVPKVWLLLKYSALNTVAVLVGAAMAKERYILFLPIGKVKASFPSLATGP